MDVTTKPVGNLDQDKLQELIDSGYTHASIRITQDLAEITELQTHRVLLHFEAIGVHVPLQYSAIRAVHKPEELQSV